MQNTTPNRVTQAAILRRSSGSAFTLLEVIVAIGAIAVVSVGLAMVFQSVGKTVVGARRVSDMTQYAALIEQQLRHDFENIARKREPTDFLVIRNQYAIDRNTGQVLLVQENSDDGVPRPRRVDEVAFFKSEDTKGARTARPPLNVNWEAQTKNSMVYYGHGILPPHRSGNIADVRPSWTEVNDPSLTGWLGESGLPNGSPNRYASQWTLLRRQVMIASPVGQRQYLPANGWPNDLAPIAAVNAPNNVLLDNISQIVGQPAVSSLFRAVAAVRWNNSGIRWDGPPRISSGMVDVTTMPISELESYVEYCPSAPADIVAGGPIILQLDPWIPGEDAAILMNAWMSNVLPTQSDMTSVAASTPADPKGGRMRYEMYPPDASKPVGTPSYISSLLADQAMLDGSKFLPRCTEFIVEWTFGEQYPADQVNLPDRKGATVWYGTSKLVGGQPQFTQYSLVGLSPLKPTPNLFVYDSSGTVRSDFAVYASAIYGKKAADIKATDLEQTACFGYHDPIYKYIKPKNGDPDIFPQAVSATWPRMVRITISLADEKDPKKEETFQWVFNLPTVSP